jgi:uncharacterized protein
VIIRAVDLDPEGLDIDSPLALGSLTSEADEVIRVEDVVVKGHVVPRRSGMSFRGTISGKVVVPCARCLAPFELEVARDFDLNYSTRPPDARETHIAEEDLNEAFLGEEEGIDLEQVAAEQIYLDLPMKPLCRPDCRGLCPGCAADLNGDLCRCPSSDSVS